MIRALCFAAFTGLMLASGAFADTQFWVAVGSYQERANADRAARDAQSQLGESFSVIGTSTDRGYFYRVVAGPYLTRDLAIDGVDGAKAAGFSGAWLWAGDESVFAGATSVDPSVRIDPLSTSDFEDVTTSSDFSTTDFSSDLDSFEVELPEFDDDFDLPRIESEPGVLDDLEPPPEFVEDAPPGYQLNKLRRDAAVDHNDPQWLASLEVYEELEEVVVDVEEADVPAVDIDSISDDLSRQLLLNLPLGDPVPLGKFGEASVDISIDGKLNEAPWPTLPGVDSFVVTDPDTLAKPRYQTIVKIFYTERGMYIGFHNEQPADTLVQRFSGRDEQGLNRDAVSITLDTSGQGRYGYWLNLALGGNQTDGTVLPERQFSSDWDGAWQGATSVTERGWEAEIFLPWSQVAMPSESGLRTINAYVSRKVAALDERWTIPALPFTQPLFISALQPLTVTEVNPRRQWSVFPYASVTQDAVHNDTEGKVGADLFYRPSTDFQITAALNPDFGNVESDDVIVNLSAFETFFPEKRLFFKEGIEVFNTAPRYSTRVLHTRRIGSRVRVPELPDDVTIPSDQLGQPADLIGAVKTVGSVGSVRYGVLAASEDDTEFDIPGPNVDARGSDYSVARFLYEDKGADGSYRAIGTISTLAAHSDENAFVQGVDLHYLTARGSMKVDGQLLYSNTDDRGSGNGGFMDVTYRPSKGTRYKLSASHYDDKLDINDLGFLRRNDVSQFGVNAEYRWSSPKWAPWARKASWKSFFDVELNGDGDKTNRGVGTRVGIDFENKTEVRVSLNYHPERIDDRNSRGNGKYTKRGTHFTSFDFRSDSSRPLYYEVGIGHAGEEAGGNRVRASAGVTWRPVEHFNIGAFAQYQVRDGWMLWQGDRNFTSFETKEWRPNVNLNYFLSAKQQLKLSAQWVGIRAEEDQFYAIPVDEGELVEVERPTPDSDDFAISNLALQLRYRWEIAPLSELFVVYTLNGDQAVADSSFTDLLTDAYRDPSNEQLVVKLRYRLGT